VTVDARDRDRYLGRLEPIDPVAGHIPGAANIPWQSFTDERGFIVPLSQQEALWQPYVRSPEIVAYCGSGVTACVNLLSLGLIGRQDAKLYPGGWSDWCSHSILVDPPD
jgi:thiosulfate/3-mercaptopyruvate sulfurtransferase